MDHRVSVDFGGVSIGDETLRLSVAISRERISLEMADRLFASKVLSGRIQIGSGDPVIGGMDEPPQVESTFHVKKFGVTAKAITCGLAFNMENVDIKELAGFAGRSGVLIVYDISDLKKGKKGKDDEKPAHKADPSQRELPLEKEPESPVAAKATKDKKPRKAKGAAAEDGPADPPPSNGKAPKAKATTEERFNLGTPFAGLEIHPPWVEKLQAAGVEDVWSLIAVLEGDESKAGLVKSIKFAESAMASMADALERWQKTGFFLDGVTAAYDAGVAAKRDGQAAGDNPYAELDPRFSRWDDGWEETDVAPEDEDAADPDDE